MITIVRRLPSSSVVVRRRPSSSVVVVSSVVCRLSSIIYRLSSVVHRPSSVVRCPSSIGRRRSSSVVVGRPRSSSFVVGRGQSSSVLVSRRWSSSFVGRRSSLFVVARSSSFVVRHLSSVVGRRLLFVVGRRSSLVGRWSSVFGVRCSVVGRRHSSVVGRCRSSVVVVRHLHIHEHARERDNGCVHTLISQSLPSNPDLILPPCWTAHRAGLLGITRKQNGQCYWRKFLEHTVVGGLFPPVGTPSRPGKAKLLSHYPHQPRMNPLVPTHSGADHSGSGTGLGNSPNPETVPCGRVMKQIHGEALESQGLDAKP